ncbi:MAG: hypothetical protein JWN48_414 [Myxococcaceae bacterium]|nr:hypothetical protein [Myxococcaceae bacterium]
MSTAAQQPRSQAGSPHKSEQEELRDKDREERNLDEVSGQPDSGRSNNPESRETGYKGESNAGQDLTSGDG